MNNMNCEVIELNGVFKAVKGTKYGYKMGNSWCNYVSYLLMNEVNLNNWDIYYNFLHIPKHISDRKAKETIISLFKNILWK